MSSDIINNLDEANQNGYICLTVNENNESLSQSFEKTQLSDELNKKKLKQLNNDNSEYFGKEIENYENILVTIKTYHTINKIFKSYENIEGEKEDIDISIFLYEFNKILNKIIKARETSNKLYEKLKEKLITHFLILIKIKLFVI